MAKSFGEASHPIQASDCWDSATICELDSGENSVILRIKGPKFHLLKLLETTEWPELVNAYRHILNRPTEDCHFIAQVLQALSNNRAIDAFLCINQESTRVGVMKSLTPESRTQVDKRLTQVSLEYMKQTHKKENKSILATEGLLQNLQAPARTCSGSRCLADGNETYKAYTYFTIAPCLRHSFHNACLDRDHNCEANDEEGGRERPL